MNGITIVKPIDVTDAMLISSDVPETDYPAWSSTTTYALGVRTIVAADHAVYESVQAGNVGHAPASSPAWWLKVGATTRWKSFDASNSTQTITAGGASPKITYVLRPAQALGCVAVLNVSDATRVRFTLTDPVYGVVYDKSQDMLPYPAEVGWWSWYFGARRQKKQHIATDLPAFPNADLTIEISGSSTLGVGVVMMGQPVTFGRSVTTGVRVSSKSYSKKEADQYGDYFLVQGKKAKRASFPVFMDASEVDALQSFADEIDATACLFIGSGKYEAMQILGFYEDYEILINYGNYADCNINIQGLT